jgi:hypothetical protein
LIQNPAVPWVIHPNPAENFYSKRFIALGALRVPKNGSTGALSDVHFAPLRPAAEYNAGVVNAAFTRQTYVYQCVNFRSEAVIEFPNDLHLITRTFTQNANQTFRYFITKDDLPAALDPIP